MSRYIPNRFILSEEVVEESGVLVDGVPIDAYEIGLTLPEMAMLIDRGFYKVSGNVAEFYKDVDKANDPKSGGLDPCQRNVYFMEMTIRFKWYLFLREKRKKEARAHVSLQTVK